MTKVTASSPVLSVPDELLEISLLEALEWPKTTCLGIRREGASHSLNDLSAIPQNSAS